jgi:nucleotide-binding universal stress UspA family protein
MSYKDILALVDADSDALPQYALSLATDFGAHVTAAALVVDPTASIGYLEASAAFVASALDKARDAAQQSLDAMMARARAGGLAVEAGIVEAGLGNIVRALGPRLRSFDLTIVEQPRPDVPSEREIMIETALFASGRPLLIVPYIRSEPFQTEGVLVAWDGSAPAARALGDAMPMLARAQHVELVVVSDRPEGDVNAGAEAKRHLARHGIEAGLRRLGGAGDVANTLLSYASESGTDLMVMGGYGHSRLREVILGGATRGILRSMTVPVFMAH